MEHGLSRFLVPSPLDCLPDLELAIEALTRGIVNKIMHTPISTLKTAARESEATTVVELVRRLFNLQEKKAATSGGDSGGQS